MGQLLQNAAKGNRNLAWFFTSMNVDVVDFNHQFLSVKPTTGSGINSTWSGCVLLVICL